jgi:hypothetical protein
VTVKNVVFWDVAPCRSYVNRRFGGTYRLQLRGRKMSERGTSLRRWLHSAVYPEDEGDTFLRNVGSHKMFTAPYIRRRRSSEIKLLSSRKLIEATFIWNISSFYEGR